MWFLLSKVTSDCYIAPVSRYIDGLNTGDSTGSILTPEVIVNIVPAWCQAELLEALSSRCSIQPVSEVFPVLRDLHCTVNKVNPGVLAKSRSRNCFLSF